MALKCRAEEALAADGVACTRLGYEVLVKIKTDELLERDYLSIPARDDRHAPDTMAAIAGTRQMTEPITSAFEGEPHGHHPGD
jgi:hypothetical protein